MQQLSGAVAGAHFGRTVEAVAAELEGMRRISVIEPHLLHKPMVSFESSEAMAESGVSHGIK